MKYSIEVVEYGTEEIVKKIDAGESERRAGKVQDGIDRNLNHEKFFTRLVISHGDNDAK